MNAVGELVNLKGITKNHNAYTEFEKLFLEHLPCGSSIDDILIEDLSWRSIMPLEVDQISHLFSGADIDS